MAILHSQGDLWSYPGHCDVVCIPTNGSVNSQGCAIMGRGIAAQTKERLPGVHFTFGKLLTRYGNGLYYLGSIDGTKLLSFPVKHKWNFDADLQLIEKSACALREMTVFNRWCKVVLPKVGCGYGHLHWIDVYPVLKRGLCNDDRFIIVHGV